jgi:hypothetical protein
MKKDAEKQRLIKSEKNDKNDKKEAENIDDNVYEDEEECDCNCRKMFKGYKSCLGFVVLVRIFNN